MGFGCISVWSLPFFLLCLTVKYIVYTKKTKSKHFITCFNNTFIFFVNSCCFKSLDTEMLTSVLKSIPFHHVVARIYGSYPRKKLCLYSRLISHCDLMH